MRYVEKCGIFSDKSACLRKRMLSYYLL